MPRHDGGTGRRKGLKIPREQNSRAGSIPARGTTPICNILLLLFKFNKYPKPIPNNPAL
jgi:hypothetical protein